MVTIYNGSQEMGVLPWKSKSRRVFAEYLKVNEIADGG
jgi:hypothetical protein